MAHRTTHTHTQGCWLSSTTSTPPVSFPGASSRHGSLPLPPPHTAFWHLPPSREGCCKPVLGVCLHLPIIFPPPPPHTHTSVALMFTGLLINMLLGQCHVPRCFSCFDLLVMEVFKHLVLRFIKATADHQLDLHQMMMSWCLMSSDVIWHIRDKLWPMPKHGSIKSTYVRCMRV